MGIRQINVETGNGLPYNFYITLFFNTSCNVRETLSEAAMSFSLILF